MPTSQASFHAAHDSTSGPLPAGPSFPPKTRKGPFASRGSVFSESFPFRASRWLMSQLFSNFFFPESTNILKWDRARKNDVSELYLEPLFSLAMWFCAPTGPRCQPPSTPGDLHSATALFYHTYKLTAHLPVQLCSEL